MSDPKIARMEVIRVKVPYRKPSETTWNVRTGTNTVVVKLTDDDGVVGWGDCIFNQSVTAGEQLLAVYQDMVEGTSIFDTERLSAALLTAGWWNHKQDRNFIGATLVAAIEMAMWDLIGKHVGQPVYRVLGGQVAPELQLSYMVPSGPPDELEKEVAFALERGFGALSVKLAKTNRSIDDDIATIARIRELAPKARLSADVNGAWTVPTAVRALRKLEKYDLDFVETPVLGLENLAVLRTKVGVPLAADEDAWSLRKVMDVIRHQAADVVLIDLAALGGVRNYQKAADLLEAANLPAVIHSNGETLAPFAAFQVAMAHGQFFHFAHQFYYEHGETYLADHPTLARTLPVFRPGHTPGLGFTVEEEKFEDMAARTGRDHAPDTRPLTQDPATVPRFPKY